MNSNLKIFAAFILGVLARIITTPWILGYHNQYFSIHKNKIFDAILFGSIIGLIQLILDIGDLSNAQKIFWLILNLTMIIITSYLINHQSLIDEKDLLLKLRENYAESIQISNIHIEKDIEEKVKIFLKEHAKTRENAIKDLDKLLYEIK